MTAAAHADCTVRAAAAHSADFVRYPADRSDCADCADCTDRETAMRFAAQCDTASADRADCADNADRDTAVRFAAQCDTASADRADCADNADRDTAVRFAGGDAADSADRARSAAVPGADVPQLEEVIWYARSQRAISDPAAFFDYYQARGWCCRSGEPIRDWRSAFRSWERRELAWSGRSGHTNITGNTGLTNITDITGITGRNAQTAAMGNIGHSSGRGGGNHGQTTAFRRGTASFGQHLDWLRQRQGAEAAWQVSPWAALAAGH